jgi:hypothetical protein
MCVGGELFPFSLLVRERVTSLDVPLTREANKQRKTRKGVDCTRTFMYGYQPVRLYQYRKHVNQNCYARDASPYHSSSSPFNFCGAVFVWRCWSSVFKKKSEERLSSPLEVLFISTRNGLTHIDISLHSCIHIRVVKWGNTTRAAVVTEALCAAAAVTAGTETARKMTTTMASTAAATATTVTTTGVTTMTAVMLQSDHARTAAAVLVVTTTADGTTTMVTTMTTVTAAARTTTEWIEAARGRREQRVHVIAGHG